MAVCRQASLALAGQVSIYLLVLEYKRTLIYLFRLTIIFPRREEEAAGSTVLAVQDGKLSPAEPPDLEAAEAAAAPLLRLSAGMEKRKAGDVAGV